MRITIAPPTTGSGQAGQDSATAFYQKFYGATGGPTRSGNTSMDVSGMRKKKRSFNPIQFGILSTLGNSQSGLMSDANLFQPNAFATGLKKSLGE